ncbi:MAG TPA: DNA polymerase III subunit delta [Candidatus Avidesulfovibrio excrementigallinarum]|nr:DNA polymerase III subunit delta [Candidatus Avidesulfovibrio excrementigallinarum]
MAKKSVAEEPQLSQQEAKQAFAPALAPALEQIRATLQRLAGSPPQVLILEGGRAVERLAVAKWYAAQLNCPHVTSAGPCLDCPVCLQTGAGILQDCTLLGVQEPVSIEAVREVRSRAAEAPHGRGWRVIVLAEAQFLRAEAANALLKVMEEPRPNLCFLLLAPQRGKLLPTLVSRGWVLTLPWPVPDSDDASLPGELGSWIAALDDFLSTGRGWFEKTSVKNAVDADLARQLILAVQKSLAATLARRTAACRLGARFAGLPDAGCAYVDDVLAQCQRSLDLPTPVNPALVLDWMAVRLYLAVRKSAMGGRS